MTNPKYLTLLGKEHLFAPAFIGSLLFHCHSKIHSWLGCGRHMPSRQQQQGCGAPAYMQHKSCKNSYIIMCGGAFVFLMLFCNNLQSGALMYCSVHWMFIVGFQGSKFVSFFCTPNKMDLEMSFGFVFVTTLACIFNWE